MPSNEKIAKCLREAAEEDSGSLLMTARKMAGWSRKKLACLIGEPSVSTHLIETIEMCEASLTDRECEAIKCVASELENDNIDH